MLLRAASATRALARTDTFMPMKPVAPDSTAPIRKPIAVGQPVGHREEVVLARVGDSPELVPRHRRGDRGAGDRAKPPLGGVEARDRPEQALDRALGRHQLALDAGREALL